MRFKQLLKNKISHLNNKQLLDLYKQGKIWLNEDYEKDKKDGKSDELIEKLIEIEDEIKRRDMLLRPKFYCSHCKKFWNNDAYCPHSFDEDELWRIYKKTKFGKIKFFPLPNYKKIEFWDKDGSFIDEYYEPI